MKCHPSFFLMIVLLLFLQSCGKETNTSPIEELLFSPPAYPEVDPTDFDALSPKLIDLLETFNNNSRGWSEGSNSDYDAIFLPGGVYSFFNKTNNRQYNFWVDHSINDWEDFQIITQINVAGSGDYYGGLLLGDEDNEKHINFVFSNNKRYTVTITENGNRTDLQDWTEIPFEFELGEIVEMSIRKFRDDYFFFINQQYTGFSTSFQGGFNGRIGFSVGPQDTLQARLLKLEYLEF